ncbi:MAG: N-acetylmuramoyl-L-alanine amidase [Candidatus Hydrogenedentes bacterium]|nr:N-acetylmuramoyl-L-alanine amidase [Candidatus Hydrogenedentota bacterium]
MPQYLFDWMPRAIAGCVFAIAFVAPRAFGNVQVSDIDFAFRTANGLKHCAPTQHAPFPFTVFGLRLNKTPEAVQHLEVSVRFSCDNSAWSPWREMTIDVDGSDPGDGPTYFGLVFAENAVSQFEAQLSAEDGSVTHDEIEATATVINPGPTPTAAKQELQIVKRKAWGCPDRKHSPLWPPEYATITHLVVHHTAKSNAETDWAAAVRAIWAYDTYTRGWGDIGYNYLCDPNGVVYEGRAGGNGVTGAHFSCQNTGTVGIAMLGTFDDRTPKKKQLRALERILATTARKNNIDPLETVFHPGMGIKLDSICGHRDGNDSDSACTHTVCPGDSLYDLLPSIRMSVAERIGSKYYGESTFFTKPAMFWFLGLSIPSGLILLVGVIGRLRQRKPVSATASRCAASAGKHH